MLKFYDLTIDKLKKLLIEKGYLKVKKRSDGTSSLIIII